MPLSLALFFFYSDFSISVYNSPLFNSECCSTLDRSRELSPDAALNVRDHDRCIYVNVREKEREIFDVPPFIMPTS